MNDRLLSLSEISKVFVTSDLETHALSRINLEVRAGEYVAIKGPSGCGKSTLLSIMGLMEPPSDGSYHIRDQDVSQLGLTRRAQIRNRYIGFIFQQFNLIGEMTVLDNVALPLSYRGISRRARRSSANQIIERVGLQSRAGHFPNQLSGGQQQRVAIARAMVGNPELLLADEPTGNLDSASADSIMQLLADIHREGTTICLVTHDARYASASERTVEMLDGKVVTSSSAEVP